MFKYVWIIPWSIICFVGSIFSSVFKNWGKSMKNGLINFLTKVLPYVFGCIIFIYISKDPMARQLLMQYVILIGIIYFIYKWLKKYFKKNF